MGLTVDYVSGGKGKGKGKGKGEGGKGNTSLADKILTASDICNGGMRSFDSSDWERAKKKKKSKKSNKKSNKKKATTKKPTTKKPTTTTTTTTTTTLPPCPTFEDLITDYVDDYSLCMMDNLGWSMGNDMVAEVDMSSDLQFDPLMALVFYDRVVPCVNNVTVDAIGLLEARCQDMPTPDLMKVEAAMTLEETYMCFTKSYTEAETVFNNMLNGNPSPPFLLYGSS